MNLTKAGRLFHILKPQIRQLLCLLFILLKDSFLNLFLDLPFCQKTLPYPGLLLMVGTASVKKTQLRQLSGILVTGRNRRSTAAPHVHPHRQSQIKMGPQSPVKSVQHFLKIPGKRLVHLPVQQQSKRILPGKHQFKRLKICQIFPDNV